MTQFKFESDERREIREPARQQPPVREESRFSSTATDFMSFSVRLMGIFMLIVGLWMGVKVIVEVWALYRGPQHIERFADAIDQGSNLDKVLASFTGSQSKKPVDTKNGATNLAETTSENIRVSYFLAWVIVIFLLMLIGRLALLAIKTGGELALYDLQVKKFARELMKEVREPDKRHSRR